MHRLLALLLVACDKLAEITGNKDDKKAATAPAGKADKKGKDAPAIPVVVAPVVEQTVPVKIQAIGNVEVQTSVAIKSRVDGQIMRTAFADGQDVAKGQVLFEIDATSQQAAVASLESVRVAREVSGAEKVHAVGYCIGGTLLSTYMAWMAARVPAAEHPVAHWTLLATLVDFQSPGDIEVFIDEGSVAWLTDKMRARGYLDGPEMASTFRLLRSNSLIWPDRVCGVMCSCSLALRMPPARDPSEMKKMYGKVLRNRSVVSVNLSGDAAKPGALT